MKKYGHHFKAATQAQTPAVVSYSTEKGKALRKHSMHGKMPTSVLLNLFISGYEECHTTDVPERMSELYIQM